MTTRPYRGERTPPDRMPLGAGVALTVGAFAPMVLMLGVLVRARGTVLLAGVMALACFGGLATRRALRTRAARRRAEARRRERGQRPTPTKRLP